jgi:hypothetical protein
VLRVSTRAGSAVEVVRRGSRVFWLACRACSARGDADVAGLLTGKWW